MRWSLVEADCCVVMSPDNTRSLGKDHAQPVQFL